MTAPAPIADDTRWQIHAACSGADPELFFPHPADHGEEALAICADCTVRTECLTYATNAGEQGIWGGVRLYPARGRQAPRSNVYRQRRTADEQLVLTAATRLQLRHGHATVRAVVTETGLSNDRARRVLNGLAASGTLRLEVAPTKGSAAIYTLSPGSPQ